MKPSTWVVVWLGMLATICWAQSNQPAVTGAWEWQNPLPAGNPIWDVDFVDSQHGWMVGDRGTILHTRDGGQSWSPQTPAIELVQSRQVFDVHFREVKFLDPAIGLIGGFITFDSDSQVVLVVLRTENEGLTWRTTFSFNGAAWLDMFFIDDSTGWIFVNEEGAFKTIDGGVSWFKVGNVPPPFSNGGVQIVPTGLFRLFFTTKDTGWGALEYEALYQTTDSGRNWRRKTIRGLGLTNDIFFSDRQNGWLIDENGHVFSTDDGGANWTLDNSLSFTYLNRIHYTSKTAGLLLGYRFSRPDSGIVFQSTELNEWHAKYSLVDIFLNSIDVVNGGNQWIAGPNLTDTGSNFAGQVLSSANNGESWSPMISGILADIVDLQFLNHDTGWALGVRKDSPGSQMTVVLATDNGGQQWREQAELPSPGATAIAMIDTDRGFLVCGWDNNDSVRVEGALYATRNSWAAWDSTHFIGRQLFDIQFVDVAHGWIGGSRGLILWTDDSGDSWHKAQLDNADSAWLEFRQIHFIDAQHGWAAAWNGSEQSYALLVESIDGGKSWQPVWREANFFPEDLAFIDSIHGWMIKSPNILLRTSDRGRSWEPQSLTLPDFMPRLIFTDRTHGWVLSNKGFVGHTSDGGISWQVYPSPAHGLLAMTFVDSAHGWIAGSQGKILRFAPKDPSTSITELELGLPTSVTLHQNFPNPFNPATMIRYELPNSGRVFLRIYSTLGRQIRTLVDGVVQSPGSHAATWDGKDHNREIVASGVYLNRLEVNNTVSVGKMMLLR